MRRLFFRLRPLAHIHSPSSPCRSKWKEANHTSMCIVCVCLWVCVPWLPLPISSSIRFMQHWKVQCSNGCYFGSSIVIVIDFCLHKIIEKILQIVYSQNIRLIVRSFVGVVDMTDVYYISFYGKSVNLVITCSKEKDMNASHNMYKNQTLFCKRYSYDDFWLFNRPANIESKHTREFQQRKKTTHSVWFVCVCWSMISLLVSSCFFSDFFLFVVLSDRLIWFFHVPAPATHPLKLLTNRNSVFFKWFLKIMAFYFLHSLSCIEWLLLFPLCMNSWMNGAVSSVTFTRQKHHNLIQSSACMATAVFISFVWNVLIMKSKLRKLMTNQY